jgi:predicted PurR-regulated permease PerM
MFYVILTIVILVVFATILSAPKQKVQSGGYAGINVDTIIESITQLDTLRSQVEGLKETIAKIAPELPVQSNVINEIRTRLNTFQSDFFGQLNSIASRVETQLIPPA